ncbi:MAG: LytTR family DNA-binding domain-containing protein [Chitinophagales bacterium]|nr:LytTR family DNA-binding domain-containing protein [Chitinophagales bacterium]
MNYKVLIVDDEEPARDLLKSYADKIDELEIQAVLSNALDAKRVIDNGGIDILLSDIQMDDLTGIDLVRTLKNPPVTIFTTAYSEYALEGFELDIVDYLVKPISFQRFCKAIDKAIELIRFRKSAQSLKPNTTSKIPDADYFFVKTNRKMVKVEYAEILFVESYGEYVKIYTKDDVILALQRTSFMEKILPSENFIRIHRSHIININHIKEIDGNIVVIDRHKLTISKRMKEAFILEIGKKGII